MHMYTHTHSYVYFYLFATFIITITTYPLTANLMPKELFIVLLGYFQNVTITCEEI